MKKLLTMLVSVLVLTSLTGCPTPNATDGNGSDNSQSDGSGSDNNTGSGTGLAALSKQQFLNLLDCYAEKSGTPAAQAAIGAVKVQVNAISDADWAKTTSSAASSFKVHYDLATKAGCTI